MNTPSSTHETDIWTSDDDEYLNDSERSRVSAMTKRDWNKIESNITKDGYRQGLESSQEEALQDGFNAAFKQSLKMAMAAGRLQGEICARLQGSPVSPSMKNGEELGGHLTSQQSQLLSDVNKKISALISNIPKGLLQLQESLKERECYGCDEPCEDCDFSEETIYFGQENTKVKDKECSDSDSGAALLNNVDFWNELEKYQSTVNYSFNSI